MTRKEEHLIMDCDIQWDGAGYHCVICGKLYSVSGVMSAPTPPQAEEHYGTTSVDGLPVDEAIKKQNKENRDRNKAIDNLAQEQWMEEFDRKFRVYKLQKVDGIIGESDTLQFPVSVSEIKAFISTQLEAAEKRGYKRGVEDSVAEILSHQFPTNEGNVVGIGYINKTLASLTNHN